MVIGSIDVPNELYPYNALDCAGTLQLLDPYLPRRAKEDNVYDLYKQRLIPA